ncbi:MAG: CHAT domain-containing tetratricopeptide repeat protein [Bacteroidales bacterium]|jgi:tetratricopeptide (TPR) repeat protein
MLKISLILIIILPFNVEDSVGASIRSNKFEFFNYNVVDILLTTETHLNSQLSIEEPTNPAKIKVYKAAISAHKNQNNELALELYNQFISLIGSQEEEKYFWQEIRLSYSYISSILTSRDNYEKANSNLKKALEITLRYNSKDYENIFHLLQNIGINYYNQSDYNNSLDYYQQADAVYRSTNSLPLESISHIYNNLALSYYKLGMIVESKKFFNESIKIKTNIGHLKDLAINYNNIGLVYQKNKEYSEALMYFSKSLQLQDSIINPDETAFILNNIGNMYLEKGSLDTSKYYYLKSLSIRKNSIEKQVTDLIVSYNNLSFIFNKLNILDSARLFNIRATNLNNIELRKKSVYNNFSISDYLTSIADRIEINYKIFDSNQNSDYLIESYELFNPVVNLIIDQLTKYNSVFSTNVFLNEHKRFFDVSLLSSLILDSINPANCPRSLIISETYKSLSLLNSQSEIRNSQGDSVSIVYFNNLNNYYQWQNKLIENTKKTYSDSNIQIIDSLINSALEIDIQSKESLDFLRIKLKKYYSNISDSILSNGKKLLDKILIDLFICADAVIIQTISENGFSCKSIPAGQEFTGATVGFLRSIKSLDQKSTESFGNVLWKYLLGPISNELIAYNNITIITDPCTSEIPFEVLPYPTTDPFNYNYLANCKFISYRFSILTRNYYNIIPNEKYSEDLLGVAPFNIQDTNSQNLKGSVKEVVDIVNLYRSKGYNASKLIGDSATFYNVASSRLNPRILHISTHSFTNNINLNLSFLEIFPDSKQFCLFLPVLSNIPFQNELLLLNACETGNNLTNTSTGFISFVRSMTNINTKNYICTLWKIFDDSSYLFIVHFYNQLINGYNYAQALTLSKRKFLNSGIYKHPLFWSPFILYENN